jgi:hypothetical protein
MGGSGGYFTKKDAENVIKQIRKSEDKTQNVELDSQVSVFINDLLRSYNNRDAEQIQQHLESIKKALEKEIEGTIDLIFGGSISRHTYVDGFSDVDSLVILDSCELANETPSSAKEYMAQRLRERFPNTPITTGDLAVTVNFATAKVQLVPAVRCENDITISDGNGKKWLKIKPKEFSKALSNVNEQNSGKLVPMIKIAKGINSKLPVNQQLAGYHVESLAIEIFKNYDGAKNTKQMLRHFFNEASARVMKPIKDKTGQTIHVDDYLGIAESPERRLCSNALNRVSRKMKNADAFNSLQEWMDILN